VRAAIDRAFDDPASHGAIERFVDQVRTPGWSNALSAKLLQLAAPGVPDVYQGSELWETSLVDPDNRRPVDFDQRRTLLERIDDGWLPRSTTTGAAKLLVTSTGAARPTRSARLLDALRPGRCGGWAAEHAVAFDRGGAIAVATRFRSVSHVAAAGATRRSSRPTRPWTDVISGRRVEGGTVALATLLDRYPVALLVADEVPS
jgi:(1->4)-alpha-D-glucan 1-alpha-D-glucosylmutase